MSHYLLFFKCNNPKIELGLYTELNQTGESASRQRISWNLHCLWAILQLDQCIMSWHGPSLWADSPETLGHIYQPASPRSFHRAGDGSCPPGKHHLSPSFFSLFFFGRFLIPHRGTCGSDKVNTSHNSLGGLSPGVDDDDVLPPLFLCWGTGKSIFCKLKFPEWRIQCEGIEILLIFCLF